MGKDVEGGGPWFFVGCTGKFLVTEEGEQNALLMTRELKLGVVRKFQTLRMWSLGCVRNF